MIVAGLWITEGARATDEGRSDNGRLGTERSDSSLHQAELQRVIEETHEVVEAFRGVGQVLFAELRADIERRIAEIIRNPSFLPQFPGEIRNPNRARQDEVSVRTESNLGKPSTKPSDPRGSEGPWLATRSNQFVNIKKEAFIREASPYSTPQGIQMTASVVAETSTRVAIYFAAEAYVEELPPPETIMDGPSVSSSTGEPTPASASFAGNSRMFVRGLVDGSPANPTDVVFAVGTKKGVRSFIFTTTVSKGIHTVEVQWMVDPPAAGSGIGSVVGYMRDASLLVRQGRVFNLGGSLVGNFSVRTAPSGPSATKTTSTWSVMPNMVSLVRVGPDNTLTASMSAESRSTGDTRMAVRALVDGVPMVPEDLIFAEGSKPQSRTATFVLANVSPGVHVVSFQWFADGNGEIEVGDRSMVLAAFRTTESRPTHPAIALSGVQDSWMGPFDPIPGMELPVWIPDKGNGEVAVIFSAEVFASKDGRLAVGLQVDNKFDAESIVELTTDADEPEVRSWVLDAKKLTPGLHTVSLLWSASPPFAGVEVTMGDRTMAIIAEVGAIPDLAEAPLLGGGTFAKNDNVTGIEPVIGTRDVLVILWDARRPGQPDRDSPGYDKATIRQRLFGNMLSARKYFQAASGGRFTIREAGILGWFDANFNPASNYWNQPPGCNARGYSSGHSERAAEAVRLAAQDGFPFGTYDQNNDGRLDSNELAIVIIYPQGSGRSGVARFPLWEVMAGCNFENENKPLFLDGVFLTTATECFGCDTLRWNAVAHELGHEILGLDDMYLFTPGGGWTIPNFPGVATRGRWKAMMALDTSQVNNTSIFNPGYRLALGWVTPRIVEQSDRYATIDTKLNDTVFVLPRYNHERDANGNPTRDEYFIVENRQSGLGDELYDDDLRDSGLGIWHVIEDPNDNARSPIGVPTVIWTDPNQITFTQTRRGIRLLRPWTMFDFSISTTNFSTTNSFWDSTNYDVISDDCPLIIGPPGGTVPLNNTLTWADCSPSGYNVRNISSRPFLADPAMPISTRMTFDVDID